MGWRCAAVFSDDRSVEIRLDYAEQKQNEHDRQDEAKSATTVIAQAGPHAISAVAEAEDQDDENNNQQHSFNLLRSLIYGAWQGVNAMPFYRSAAARSEYVQQL
jgi:SH3-like domain-containing protein